MSPSGFLLLLATLSYPQPLREWLPGENRILLTNIEQMQVTLLSDFCNSSLRIISRKYMFRIHLLRVHSQIQWFYSIVLFCCGEPMKTAILTKYMQSLKGKVGQIWAFAVCHSCSVFVQAFPRVVLEGSGLEYFQTQSTQSAHSLTFPPNPRLI